MLESTQVAADPAKLGLILFTLIITVLNIAGVKAALELLKL